MSVWYRRSRNRLSYRFRQNKHKVIMIYIIFILSVIAFIFALFTKQTYPYLKSVANNYATRIATKAVNEAVIEKISENGVSYRDYITISKDSNGKIEALEANMINFNKLKSEIIKTSEKQIEYLDSQHFGIPIGTLTNNMFLIGRGPKIPINLVPYGSSTVEFTNSFTDAGINQTRHSIGMDIKTKIAILLPIGISYTEVTNNIPVAETVLVGVVPDNYTNFMGTEGDAKDGILNQIGQ